MIRPIDTLEEFLAHAIAIEREATERYREFELYYVRRGNDALAALCGQLALMEGEHLEQLRSRSRGLDLPILAETEYRWLEGESPEAPPRSAFFASNDRRDLLGVALRAEAATALFFGWVARTSRNAEVRAMAGEMAREERQHAEWIEKALGYRPASPIPA